MWPKNTPTTQIVTFITITLLTSWGLALVINKTETMIALAGVLMVIPTIVAVTLNIMHHQSIMQIYKPVFSGTSRKSILIAIIYPIAFTLLIGVIALISNLAQFNTGNFPDFYDLIFTGLGIILTMIVVFGEEYGWRGFLLPALATRFGKLKATMLVGIIWAAYQVPSIYLISHNLGTGNPWLTSILQGLSLFLLSFPISYCYFTSKSSILGVMLFRAAWDVANSMILSDGSTDMRSIFAGEFSFFGTIPIQIIIGIFAAIWFARKLQEPAIQRKKA